MMTERIWLMRIVAVLALSVCSLGQSAGNASTGARRIQAAGFTFMAPAGWKVQQDKGYLLVDPSGHSMVMLAAHNYNDFASVLRNSKLDENESVSAPQDLKGGGKTVRVTKTTAEGVGVIDVFVLFSPSGGGVLVLAVSEGKNADAAFYSGLNVANSVSFPGTALPRPLATGGSAWQPRLTGKHLLYLYSGNGYFEEKHIYLCSSGTFYQSTGSGGFTPNDSDGGSFAAKGGKRGRWSVDGSVLSLQFQDGSVGEYNLTQRSAGNEIGMNGRRYFVQSNANCN